MYVCMPILISYRGKGIPVFECQYVALSIFHLLFNAFWQGRPYFPHVLEEEMKAQTGSVTSPKVRQPVSVKGSITTQVDM